jgi:hypothetical protein
MELAVQTGNGDFFLPVSSMRESREKVEEGVSLV